MVYQLCKLQFIGYTYWLYDKPEKTYSLLCYRINSDCNFESISSTLWEHVHDVQSLGAVAISETQLGRYPSPTDQLWTMTKVPNYHLEVVINH